MSVTKGNYEQRDNIWRMIFLHALILAVVMFVFSREKVMATPNGLTFPVLGGGSFSNDFTAPRSSGQHRATDIFAVKHTPIVSPVDGIVYYVMNPQPAWGWSLGIRDTDGYEYNFLHLNNDNDGTDDGAGGAMKAYSYDMKVGNHVVKGQHLGWVGDSGNAETTPPHLHFEIYHPDGHRLNPYDYLVGARRIGQPVINTNPQVGEFLPFGPYATNDISIASGDVDGDGTKEYVVSAKSGYPQVRIYNNNHTVRSWGFPAYAESYRGGVNIAMGDIDGDGKDEIITGTAPGSTTHVRIFKNTGEAIGGFFAYPGYYTGVNVTTGDIDGDGKDEIITGTGPGSTSHVKSFKPSGQLVNGHGFFAYPGFYTGADVATGDVDGDGQIEIVTATNEGNTPHIKIFTPLGIEKNNFFAYENFYGGAQIAVDEIIIGSLGQEIVVVPRSRGGPDFRIYNKNGSLLRSRSSWEVWWSGSYDIAYIGNGKAVVVTGGSRRTSVRQIQF